jgi:hypothetical protein
MKKKMMMMMMMMMMKHFKPLRVSNKQQLPKSKTHLPFESLLQQSLVVVSWHWDAHLQCCLAILARAVEDVGLDDFTCKDLARLHT